MRVLALRTRAQPSTYLALIATARSRVLLRISGQAIAVATAWPRTYDPHPARLNRGKTSYDPAELALHDTKFPIYPVRLADKPKDESYRMMFDANPLPMWVYDFDSSYFVAVNERQ